MLRFTSEKEFIESKLELRLAQKERNACISSSDGFAKIGQAICAILT